MGEHKGLLHSVSGFMEACGRRVVRASRRLRKSSLPRSLDWKITPRCAPHFTRRISMIPFPGGKRKGSGARGEKANFSSEEEETSDEEDGVWRRTILMGEKCQPLEFAGVIYYDSKGRPLPGPPRSPLRSPLPSFSYVAAAPDASDKK